MPGLSRQNGYFGPRVNDNRLARQGMESRACREISDLCSWRQKHTSRTKGEHSWEVTERDPKCDDTPSGCHGVLTDTEIDTGVENVYTL